MLIICPLVVLYSIYEMLSHTLFFYICNFYLFIYFWLHQLFISMHYDQIPNLGLNKPPAHSPTDSSEGLLGAASLNFGRGSTGPRRRWTGPDRVGVFSVFASPSPGQPLHLASTTIIQRLPRARGF